MLCVRARASLHGTFKAVDLLYIWVYNSYTDSSVSLLFAFSFFFENKELSKIKRVARGTATQIAVDASCQTQEPPGGGES